MDGIDLAQEFKMRWPHLVVILTSANASEHLGQVPPGVEYMLGRGRRSMSLQPPNGQEHPLGADKIEAPVNATQRTGGFFHAARGSGGLARHSHGIDLPSRLATLSFGHVRRTDSTPWPRRLRAACCPQTKTFFIKIAPTSRP
jgi:hypothetical protein